MNFEVLVEIIGERGVEALLSGLHTSIKDAQRELVENLHISVYSIWHANTILRAMDQLACLKDMREQYDEIHKAVEEHEKTKEEQGG